MKPEFLFFNGIDAETGLYVQPPTVTTAFQQSLVMPRQRGQLTRKDLSAWANPRKLNEAGWGIIFSEDEQERVKEALAPLIELRKRQAGPFYREFLFTAADRADPNAFMQRHGFNHTDVDPEHLPYYLFIVGSPESVPFQFQYESGLIHAVGRIWFTKTEFYANYAANVVRNESSPLRSKRQMVLFSAENDPLTELCTRHLVKPLASQLAAKNANWTLTSLTGSDASKGALQKLMNGSGAPPLLMTSGHAACSPRNARRRFKEQGALICSNWSGIGEPLKRNHYFSAKDLSAELELRGSILFFFACFTAGTPEYRNFEGDGRTVRWHKFPFLARLAHDLLGHPRGPLALIGHIDQAYQYSFLWDNRMRELTHFTSCFYQLMQGSPIGLALAPFNRRFAAISTEVAQALMNGSPSDDLKLCYWASYHDARNYLILGDPAAHLNLAAK